MMFFHFLVSGNMASSQSRIFSHFSFHLRNLWCKISLIVQSILDPSIYGINIGCTNCCAWLVDGWKLGRLCTSISWSELEDTCETILLSWETLVIITQAEFLDALGISGLWNFDLRPLPIDTRTLYIEQARNKLVNCFKYCEDTVDNILHTDRVFLLHCSPWDSGNLVSGHS